MMQKLERRVCECCGQSDFIKINDSHVKCAYCDTIYFTGSSNNSPSEKEHSDIDLYAKVDIEATAEALALIRQRNFERIQHQRVLDEAKEKRVEYKRKKRNSLLIHLFFFLIVSPILTSTNTPEVGVIVMIISIVNLFVRQDHYNKFYLPYLDTCAKYNL